MKNILFLVLICFVVFSCKKENDSAQADFEISQIDTIQSRVDETTVIHLMVTSSVANPDNVYLSLEEVPKGITYSFGQVAGTPDYNTDLTITVSRDAEAGWHTLKLIGRSFTSTLLVPIKINVDKSLSCTFTVYNSTTYNPDNMSSNLLDSAQVELFKDEGTFLSGVSDYKAYTNAEGKADFYKIPAGTYLFTIKKGLLSNIVQKRDVNGVNKGYVALGMFRTSLEIINSAQPKAKVGDIKYKDLNADNKIDGNDLARYDDLSIYDGDVNEKVIWLGL